MRECEKAGDERGRRGGKERLYKRYIMLWMRNGEGLGLSLVGCFMLVR